MARSASAGVTTRTKPGGGDARVNSGRRRRYRSRRRTGTGAQMGMQYVAGGLAGGAASVDGHGARRRKRSGARRARQHCSSQSEPQLCRFFFRLARLRRYRDTNPKDKSLAPTRTHLTPLPSPPTPQSSSRVSGNKSRRASCTSPATPCPPPDAGRPQRRSGAACALGSRGIGSAPRAPRVPRTE